MVKNEPRAKASFPICAKWWLGTWSYNVVSVSLVHFFFRTLAYVDSRELLVANPRNVLNATPGAVNFNLEKRGGILKKRSMESVLESPAFDKKFDIAPDPYPSVPGAEECNRVAAQRAMEEYGRRQDVYHMLFCYLNDLLTAQPEGLFLNSAESM
ncbi:hypothetical protein R1flu_003413 [Riccia fluitans]|uniref:Uncharacterized protein n=1 Tax=Riccia fluitans TaxID=41844 RepID=A0ABD1Y920_9MARC